MTTIQYTRCDGCGKEKSGKCAFQPHIKTLKQSGARVITHYCEGCEAPDDEPPVG